MTSKSTIEKTPTDLQQDAIVVVHGTFARDAEWTREG